MSTDGANTIRRSFGEVMRGFVGLIKSSYKLAPCLVIVLFFVLLVLILVALLSSKLMLGTVLLIVWSVAIIVYARTKNYGEATLALVAGLLTAYSVTWNRPRFIAFVVIWASFSFVALLVSSIRLAGKQDDILKQASLAMSDDEGIDFVSAEKQLKAIGEAQRNLALGPIERAEALRVFAFRRVPLSIMGAGLKAVAMLNVITDIESNNVARFVADVYRIFGARTAEQGEIILNILLRTIRLSAVPPADFIAAFEQSRRLVLSRSVDAATYFANLQIALDAGVPPGSMSDYLSAQIPPRIEPA